MHATGLVALCLLAGRTWLTGPPSPPGPAGRAGWRRRRAPRPGRRDAGMSTAEYAVGTVAAVALAAVLYEVVTSGSVSDALHNLVERALDAPQ